MESLNTKTRGVRGAAPPALIISFMGGTFKQYLPVLGGLVCEPDNARSAADLAREESQPAHDTTAEQ